MTTIIGVDVGGTLLRAGRFDDDLNLLDRAEQPTRVEDGADAVFDRLVETIQQVMPGSPEERVGVGVVVPGPVDMAGGLLINPAESALQRLPHRPPIEASVRPALSISATMLISRGWRSTASARARGRAI